MSIAHALKEHADALKKVRAIEALEAIAQVAPPVNDTLWTEEELANAVAHFEKHGSLPGEKALISKTATDDMEVCTWGDYRDYEKRELAFEAGVRWAFSYIRAKLNNGTYK